MLIAGYLPREFRQYAKLGRKIGLGELLNQIKGQVPLDKAWVRRYFEYLEQPDFAKHAQNDASNGTPLSVS